MLLSILLQAGGAQRITQAMQEGVSTLSTIGRIAYNGVMTIAFLVSLVSLVMLLKQGLCFSPFWHLEYCY